MGYFEYFPERKEINKSKLIIKKKITVLTLCALCSSSFSFVSVSHILTVLSSEPLATKFACNLCFEKHTLDTRSVWPTSCPWKTGLSELRSKRYTQFLAPKAYILVKLQSATLLQYQFGEARRTNFDASSAILDRETSRYREGTGHHSNQLLSGHNSGTYINSWVNLSLKQDGRLQGYANLQTCWLCLPRLSLLQSNFLNIFFTVEGFLRLVQFQLR